MDPYLEGFPGILKPSFAYLQACQSYPCRISELVFGSLLASYILGFVSVGASQVLAQSDSLVKIATVLVYLSISVTFSFLTAAFYTTYHNSILTMPNVPIDDLTNDFLIAISKAVFFGISMIWIKSYLICLGLLLLIVFWRQHRKVKRLAVFFLQKVRPSGQSARGENTAKVSMSDFTKAIKSVNEEFQNRLDGWDKVSPVSIVLTLIILAFGGCVASGWPQSIDQQWVYAVLYFGVGVGVFILTQKTLKRKSIALDDTGHPVIYQMDPAAKSLAQRLKN